MNPDQAEKSSPADLKGAADQVLGLISSGTILEDAARNDLTRADQVLGSIAPGTITEEQACDESARADQVVGSMTSGTISGEDFRSDLRGDHGPMSSENMLEEEIQTDSISDGEKRSDLSQAVARVLDSIQNISEEKTQHELQMLVIEAIGYFPKNVQQDALYQQDEIKAFFMMCESVRTKSPRCLRSVFERDVNDVLPLINYFERSGDVSSIKLFADVLADDDEPFQFGARQDVSSEPLQTPVALDNAVEVLMETVLRRVENNYGPDCILALGYLRNMLGTSGKSSRFVRILTRAKCVESFEEICKLCEKCSDPEMIENLYLLAYQFTGTRLDSKEDASDTSTGHKLRRQLIQSLTRTDLPQETKLQVLYQFLRLPKYQDQGVVCFIFQGMNVSAWKHDEQIAFFKFLFENQFDPNQIHDVVFGLPESVELLEAAAGSEIFEAVQIFFTAFKTIRGRSRTAYQQELQQRFTLATVRLFTVPSRMLEQHAVTLKPLIDDLTFPKFELSMEPLHDMWINQFVDSRLTPAYRKLALSAAERISGTSIQAYAKLVSNAVWMNDKSRFGDTVDERDLSATVRKSRFSVLVHRYDIRVMLLMTWLRAPAMLPRFQTKSCLKLLPSDVLVRLGQMLKVSNERV